MISGYTDGHLSSVFVELPVQLKLFITFHKKENTGFYVSLSEIIELIMLYFKIVC